MASSPNVSANLLEPERLISAASDSGAGLVVLPENFAFKGKQNRDMLTLCEDVEDGPLEGFLSWMAKRYGIWLVGGTIPLRASQGSKVRAA